MTNTQKPNIILMMVDQMRADALSINDVEHFTVTPTLDMMASEGYNFTNAYSTVPSCVPARAALLTGLDPEHSGRVGYEDCIPWNFADTLPQTFKDAGYQTQCIGKMHVYPSRKRLGFDNVILHDGYLHVDRKYDKGAIDTFENSSDYLSFLKNGLGNDVDMIDDGVNCNSWDARPWELPEKYHATNWLVSESIQFLKRRDQSVPFFLKMSFEKPHAPLNPPTYFFNMYMDKLPKDPDLHIGNWEKLENKVPGLYALKGKLNTDSQRRMMAGYYGLVSHIDNQISRFITALKEFRLDKNTIILFVSDHGDQLGEHYLFRKGYAYQGSIHVPLFVYDAGNCLQATGKSIDELVTLQDIYPSLVDMALLQKVDVDGQSFKPLMVSENAPWRDTIFGEHSLGIDSNQFVMTKKWKLIWHSVRDEYQLFDLENDKNERYDVYNDDNRIIIDELKQKLIERLKDRPEGFVQDGQLHAVKLDQIRATLDVTHSTQ